MSLLTTMMSWIGLRVHSFYFIRNEALPWMGWNERFSKHQNKLIWEQVCTTLTLFLFAV